MEGPEIHTSEAVIDNGAFGTRTIRFEMGRLAQQAAGSAVAYLDDDTMLLSATTAGKHPKDQFDFFPLTIDVEERMYALGRIPGSFFRREGRPSEDAIISLMKTVFDPEIPVDIFELGLIYECKVESQPDGKRIARVRMRLRVVHYFVPGGGDGFGLLAIHLGLVGFVERIGEIGAGDECSEVKARCGEVGFARGESTFEFIGARCHNAVFIELAFAVFQRPSDAFPKFLGNGFVAQR